MAKYRGRAVKLNKPFRTPGESKKFAVYVRDKKTDNDTLYLVKYADGTSEYVHLPSTFRLKKDYDENAKIDVQAQEIMQYKLPEIKMSEISTFCKFETQQIFGSINGNTY